MTSMMIVVLCFILLLTAAIGGTVWSSSRPADKNNVEQQIFNFEQDENVRNIAHELKQNNIIRSEFALRSKAKSAGVSYIAKPGKYAFSPSMTLNEIVQIIKDGRTAYDYVMVIRDGMNMDEIIDDFSVDDAEFEKNVLRTNDINYITSLREKFPFLPEDILGDGFRHRLEGFLALGEYHIKEDTTIEEYMNEALTRYQEEFTKRNMAEKLASHGKSLFEVVTMAALVRGEVFAEDFENQKMVAGVFYNRLEHGMPMGSDVTVGYSINKKDTNYTVEELENDSPYNTYVHPGLPRGPINNPSFDTVEAVMDATPNDYFYFIADICDDGHGEFGKIYYAKDEAEHDKNRYEYLACIY